MSATITTEALSPWLETIIHTQDGPAECKIRRILYGNEEVVEVDLWRPMIFKMQTLTAFRASVHMRRTGRRYRIIQPSHGLGYTNPFWQDLEIHLSNLIIVNE
jgi:hypothetical protein